MRRPRVRHVVSSSLVCLVTGASLLLAVPGAQSTGAHSSGAQTGETRTPGLRVRTVVAGLENPWDVQTIGRGKLLVTERSRARLSVIARGQRRTVRFPSRSVWVSGETGLMSLEVDPKFRRNRRFYTCQGGFRRSGHDVRVMAWRLSRNLRRARSQGALLTGLPATSGRHGGCRLLIDAADGSLWVGTGDAAVGTNARDLTSLGGKVLRMNRFTGRAWRTNPFIGAETRRQRYVVTYGHRNVQGLAQRGRGPVWSVEHGPFRDDEVNRLVPGGDYGWHPVPGYDESVPMTDQSLPGTQVEARWSSGDPTVATSGASWVRGRGWGAYRGTLAVAALKDSRLYFMRFDRDGDFVRSWTPSRMQRYGRLRSVTRLRGGALLVTTSNGTDDRVLRVSPRR